jgi:RNA-directed DNA polymerase
MTVINTDANSCRQKDWDTIDWDNIKRSVRRLQARIVKAQQEGKRRKIKNLRRLLIRSRAARTLAVKRVTTNKGKRTPGIDGEIWRHPVQKLTAVERLKCPIKPLPLRRIHIPKKNGKMRPLGIPTMLDRAHQALHLLALEPLAETTADLRSYGFRPVRSCADAIEYCYNALRRPTSPQWILEGDIKSCFDEINHDWMIQHLPMDEQVLRRWLKAGFVEKGSLFPTMSGTPQGGIASPVLANMTLDGLEAKLYEQFGAPGSKKSKRNRVFFCRFADDFIITGSSKELLEEQVKPLVIQFLEERGLRLSEEKTVITHISEGFDFLGQNLKKYKGKLLTKPSKKSFQSVKEKLKETVRKYWCKPDVMINRLNAIIRGWCNYHRHVVSSRIFSKLDHYIFQILWRKAKRSHSNKKRRWIAKRYFHKIDSRKWVFGHRQGEKLITIILATSIRIQRFIPVRGDANPFDPAWKGYFEERWTRNYRKKHPQSIEFLRKRDRNCCGLCQSEITDRKDGIIHFPTDNIALEKDPVLRNAILAHKTCHSEKLPRPAP